MHPNTNWLPGGWHPDDHAEFERILRACRGSYQHCVQLCTRELGLLHSAEDVAQHARCEWMLAGTGLPMGVQRCWVGMPQFGAV